MSTEIEKVDAGQLPELSAEEAALAGSVKDQVTADRLTLPNIKLTQALTKEVVDDEVQAGRFFNSLTKEDYGTSINFVVAGMFRGRFYSDEDNKAYAARGDVAPANWPEEYAGRNFVDIEDAEEQFRAAVDEGKREWGKGAPISTTYNFVGLIEGDDSPLPVRVSMMRGNSPVAAKIETLIKVARAPWDRMFTLTASKKVSPKGQPFYGIEVGQGGVTPPELRQSAVGVATQFRAAEAAGAVELAGDEGDAKPKRTRAKAKETGLGMD